MGKNARRKHALLSILSTQVLLSIASNAQALSFSAPQVRSYLGEPLDVRVKVTLGDNESFDTSCVSILPGGGTAQGYLVNVTPQVSGGGNVLELALRTPSSVNEPIAKVLMRSTCAGSTVTRDFTFLIDPAPGVLNRPAPVVTAPVISQPVLQPAPPLATVRVPVTTVPAIVAPTAIAVSRSTEVVTRQGDTLRILSHRYGGNTKAKRLAFIARLKETNPDLASFGNTEALPDGLLLQMPAAANAGVPQRETERERASNPGRDARRDGTPRSAEPKPAQVAAAVPRNTRATEKKVPEFSLKLSGGAMDMSRSQNLSEADRLKLREKQLLLEADDQVAALLQMRNSIRQLEARVGELQSRLGTGPTGTPALAPSTSITAAPSSALPPAEAKVDLPKADVTKPADATPAEAPKVEVPKTETAKSEATAESPKAKAEVAANTATSSGFSWWWSLPIALLAGLGGLIWFRLNQKRSAARAQAWEQSLQTQMAGNSEFLPDPHTRVIEEDISPINDGYSSNGLKFPDDEAPGGQTSPLAAFGQSNAGFDRLAGGSRSGPVHGASDDVGERLDELVAAYSKTVDSTRVKTQNTKTIRIGETTGQTRALNDLNARIAAPKEVPDLSLTRKLEAIEVESFEKEAKRAKLEAARGKFADPELESRLNVLQRTTKVRPLGDIEPARLKDYRLRYIEERFPEITKRTIDLTESKSIVKAARLFFEDGAAHRSIELLAFAIEEHPKNIALWLALMEVFRLQGDLVEVTHLAKRMKDLHHGTQEWLVVQALGREMSGGEGYDPVFHPAVDADTSMHYDPLTQNWLLAPMDFTQDVLAIELRINMLAQMGLRERIQEHDPNCIIKELVHVPFPDDEDSSGEAIPGNGVRE